MEKPVLISELILPRLNAKDAGDALLKVARSLVEHGYAKETFPEAVVAREKEFPTGLPSDGIGVAIPHCDATRVISTGLAVATLAEPVDFGVMGSFDDTIPVDILFMLAMKDPAWHLDVLGQVAALVRNQSKLNEIRALTSKEDLKLVLGGVFSGNIKG